MKRVFVYLMSFVLCILMFSCAKQETPEADSGTGGGVELPDERVPVMSLSTSIEGEKTEISTQGKVFWAKGDVLAVFAGGKAYAFELKSGMGSQNAVFACYDNGSTGKPLDGVAAYPYHESLTYDKTSGMVQVYCPHTYDAAAIPVPMVGQAHTDNDNRYYFRNMNGIFRFTYKNVPIKARTLQFTATTDISGVYNVAAQGGRLTTSSTSTALDANNTKTVKVSLPRMRKDGTVTVDIPVPTGAYKGFTIALLDKEGTAIDYTQKSPSSTITAYTRQISPIKAIDLPQGLKVEWSWENNGTLPRFTGNVPAIDAAGNVYVASDEAKLHKLDKNGKLLWTFNLEGLSGRNNGSPSLEEDGSVVYMAGGTEAGVLYAINAATGTQKWKATFPTGIGEGKVLFDRPIVAVGKGSNVYVQVNGLNTLLSISKSDGKTVAYLASDKNGTNLNRWGAGSVAISDVGTVSVQTQQGSYTVKQSLLDAPTQTHATYGKYAPYAYHDLWPRGWNMFWVEDGRAMDLNGSVSQGVICGMKGKTSGRHIAVSCAQETNHRMNVDRKSVCRERVFRAV
jgi:outer membrane protein assembly factor BamB